MGGPLAPWPEAIHKGLAALAFMLIREIRATVR